MKYLEELYINIYQLPLTSHKDLEINLVKISYYDQKTTIQNKVKLDEVLKRTPNWKRYFNKIYEPLKYIGNHLLINNNNKLDHISPFDLDHYVFSSSSLTLELVIGQPLLLKNKKYIDKIEDAISQNSIDSFKYSTITEKRFLKGEALLIDDATSSFNDSHSREPFGSDILNTYHYKYIEGRWSEFEDALIKKKRYNILLEYLSVLKIKDPYFEKILLDNANGEQIYKYYKKVLEKEEENFFFKDPVLLYYYFLDISKDKIPYDWSSDKVNSFIEELDTSAKEMFKYPELMYKYCVDNEFPIRVFEDHISESPYWSYMYVTFFVYQYGLEKKNLSPKLIKSIKTEEKLYKDIKMTLFLRDDPSYELPPDPDPSLYGEKEIIKKTE